MEDKNYILKNQTIYNKFINIKKESNKDLPHLKLQTVKKNSIFTNIISINNISSVQDYDKFKDSDKYNSLNNYYQQYPNIILNEKTFLTEIYDINNIDELKQWLNNNYKKNFKNISRIIDLSFIVFYKQIIIDYNFFQNYLVKLLKNNSQLFKNNLEDIDNDSLNKIINKSIKEFNIEKNNIITNIIIKNLNN